ncbi:hypothetical protein U9M48_037232 [Paspalum notatum var. saurae]|uniref:Uncharacterized protein n=1 Tax=Paspalum notatum var. saurae TaxID=547442 RepID=A0AAQ3UGN0_PASNO
MDSAAADRRLQGVFVPFQGQGHETPMLKLAKILHSPGFHVTFVNSEFNHRHLLHSYGAGTLDGLSGFCFGAILDPEGLPPSDVVDASTQDVMSPCRATMENCCLPHFRSLLAEVNSSPGVLPVTYVVGDDPPGTPTCPAHLSGRPACYLGYRGYRTLMEKGIFPFINAEQRTNGFSEMPVADWAPEMSKHIRLMDLPSTMRSTDPGDFMFHMALKVTKQHIAGVDAVILNTFDELEQDGLDAMLAMIPSFASPFSPCR